MEISIKRFFVERGKGSIQREIFLGRRIINREGRERSNRGSAGRERLAQSHVGLRRGCAKAKRESRNLLKESIAEARSRGVRLGGRNQSSRATNQSTEGVTLYPGALTLGLRRGSAKAVTGNSFSSQIGRYFL